MRPKHSGDPLTLFSTPRRCHDSPVYSSPGNQDSPVMNTPGCWPKLFYKKTAGKKYIRELRLPCVFVTRNFFVYLFWCFFQIHQEVDFPVYSSQGSQDSPVYLPKEFETTRCIHNRAVKTPRCIHHRGVVLDMRESYWFSGAYCTTILKENAF